MHKVFLPHSRSGLGDCKAGQVGEGVFLAWCEGWGAADPEPVAPLCTLQAVWMLQSLKIKNENQSIGGVAGLGSPLGRSNPDDLK